MTSPGHPDRPGGETVDADLELQPLLDVEHVAGGSRLGLGAKVPVDL